jgi:hypothetical protein
MPLAKHNDIVQASRHSRLIEPIIRSAYPFYHGDRSRPVTNAHRLNAAYENIAIDSIAVTDDILR